MGTACLNNRRQLQVVASEDESRAQSERRKRGGLVQLACLVHNDPVKSLLEKQRMNRALVRSRTDKHGFRHPAGEFPEIRVLSSQILQQDRRPPQSRDSFPEFQRHSASAANAKKLAHSEMHDSHEESIQCNVRRTTHQHSVSAIKAHANKARQNPRLSRPGRTVNQVIGAAPERGSHGSLLIFVQLTVKSLGETEILHPGRVCSGFAFTVLGALRVGVRHRTDHHSHN
jgi:hypothetical protein